MGNPARMSPLTAFFFGLFALGCLFVAAVTSVTLYGMNIFQHNASNIIDLVDGTIEHLPQTINELSPAVTRLVGDRRSDYATKIAVTAQLSADPDSGRLRPTLQVVNQGRDPITFLTVRVAALTAQNIPVAEWTEIVATPVAIENDLRGPLGPNQTRYVVLHNGWSLPADYATKLTLAHEIVDVFVPGHDDADASDHVGTD